MPVVTSMTPERWQRVKKILEESLAREASARVAYLEGACAGDDDLKRDVESFLAHERPDDFLEHPAIGRPPPVPDSALAGPVPDRNRTRVRKSVPSTSPRITRLLVSTRSTRYELIVVAPLELELLVKGGRRFPHATHARFHRHDAIKVGEVLRLQVGTRKDRDNENRSDRSGSISLSDHPGLTRRDRSRCENRSAGSMTLPAGRHHEPRPRTVFSERSRCDGPGRWRCG